MSMVRAYPGIHIGRVPDPPTRDALKAIDIYLRDASRAVQAPAGGSATGATVPTAASFVTVSAEATLTSERRLTVTSPLTLTDNGAGSTVVIAGATIMTGPGSSTSGDVATFN